MSNTKVENIEIKVKSSPIINRYGKRRIFIVGLFVMILWWCIVDLGISPGYFLEGIPHFIRLVREMIPPNWEVFVRGGILWSLLETLSMAFVGTFLGVVLSFFLGLSAASNLAPSKVIREVARGIMALERTVPALVVSLIFFVIVGFGPFAGMLAIAIGSIGMLGKLFADAIEGVDPKPLESMASVGATKSQIIRYAVLPQVLPSFIANALFRFDINTRVAIVLGAVGGGGIGHELLVAMRLFRYPDALAITVLILVLIVSAERASDYLRKRIIGQEVLK